jgi:hypothetical protein
MVEARGADGERRLLQLARFRAPANERERTARQAEERSIAKRTTDLLGDPEVTVHAHGGVDVIGGERLLFWALPFSDRPSLADETLTPSEVLDVAVRLARRLAERHEAGRLDPILSEHLIKRRKEGLEVVGVPLAIDRGLVSPRMPPYRYAPEENGVPLPSGDLYRLGRLLSNLSVDPPLPPAVRAAIDRLIATAGRYATAKEVLSTLERLRTPSGPDPAKPAHPTSLAGGSPRAPLANPTDAVGVKTISDDAATEPTNPLDPLAAVPEVSLPEIDPLSWHGTDPGLSELDPGVLSEAVTKKAEPITPIPSNEPDVVTISVEEGEVPSAVISRATFESDLVREKDGLDPFDAFAASWRQPVLPSGESPWSEVVEARGTHTRARDRFEGYSDAFPPLDDRPRSPPMETRAVPDAEIDEETAAAITGFDTRKLVVAVLSFLVIFGVLALIARSGNRSGGKLETSDHLVEVPPTNELLLESDPQGATVVAESDGTILGKTPLEFLVSRGTEASVFLALPGHEPLRMTLPERGAIRARLMPLAAEPCEMQLRAVGAKLQGIGFELGDGDDSFVPGAGIVRGIDGLGVGAKLVSCPALGGKGEVVLDFDPRGPTKQVKIMSPAGAQAFVDGDPAGLVPTVAEAKRSFIRIRVDGASGMSEERLVPADRNIEVHMPVPKARKMPVLLVPGDETPEQAEIAEPLAPASDEYRQAVEAVEANDVQLAKARFSRCLEADPNDPLCHRGLGDLYRRLRSPQKAKQHFARYLELVPDAPDADRIREMINGG